MDKKKIQALLLFLAILVILIVAIVIKVVDDKKKQSVADFAKTSNASLQTVKEDDKKEAKEQQENLNPQQLEQSQVQQMQSQQAQSQGLTNTTPTQSANKDGLYIKSVEEFNKVIASNEKTAIDFYADWCGPCRMMSPVIDQVKSQGYRIYKVNIDDFQDLAVKYGVRGIPDITIFQSGKALKKIVGVQPEEKIVEALKQ